MQHPKQPTAHTNSRIAAVIVVELQTAGLEVAGLEVADL